MSLHPFIKAMLEKLSDRPALSAGTPDDARRLLAEARAALGPPAEVASVAPVTVPTRGGDREMILIKPSQGTPAGLIVYVHGGGWVVGAPEDFEVYARALALASGCAVLLARYRLAPEHRFPAGLEDVEDVLVWAQENQRALCGATVPTVAAGDSAGANLVTVALRRLGSRAHVALQELMYPVADADMTRPSYATYGEGLPLTKRDMDWFFTHYTDGPREHPDVSPLRADDLSGLPPTIVVLASHDVLHDEGRAYAERLEDAGVPVTLRVLPGLTHGFIRLHNHLDVSEQEVRLLGREIAEACDSASGDRT